MTEDEDEAQAMINADETLNILDQILKYVHQNISLQKMREWSAYSQAFDDIYNKMCDIIAENGLYIDHNEPCICFEIDEGC